MQFRNSIVPLGVALLGVSVAASSAQAQIVATPAGALGATGTNVSAPAGAVTITGGTTTGTNLFHSFSQFSLSDTSSATFQPAAGITNILSRVEGGSTSVINGAISVAGNAGANLYLMNPSGIIFGPNATLNVPASFVPTTAAAIGFNDITTVGTAPTANYFNAVGNNVYGNLTGGPTSLLFPPGANGAIVNLGNLSVPAGANNALALFGGTVLQATDVNAPGANVIAASVPSPRVVRFSQPGNLLSLEFPAGSFAGTNGLTQGANGAVTFTGAPVASLPALITGGGFAAGASGVTVNGGVVTLTGAGGGAGTVVNAGDIVARNINITPAAGAAAGPNAGSVLLFSNGNLVAGNVANAVAPGANIALSGNGSGVLGATQGGGTVRLASGFFPGQGSAGGTLNVGNIQNAANISLESGGNLVGGQLSTQGVTAGRNDAITLSSRSGNISVINLLANNANAAGAAGTGGNIVINAPGGSFQSSGTLALGAFGGGGAGGANTTLNLLNSAGAAGSASGAASVAARGTININQQGLAGSNFIQGANLERDANNVIIYRLASDQTIRVLINGVNADGSLILSNAATGAAIPGGGNVVVRQLATGGAIGGGGGSQGLIIRLNGANGGLNGGLGLSGIAGSQQVVVNSAAGGVITGNAAAGQLPGGIPGAPATPGNTPGTGGTNPGVGGDTPGTGGTNPGVGGNTPGTGGTNPGVGNTPGTGGTNPGIGNTPGTGGTNPGVGNTPGTGGSNGGVSGNTGTRPVGTTAQQAAANAQDQIELTNTNDLSAAQIAAASSQSDTVIAADANASGADEGVLTRRVSRQVEVPTADVPVVQPEEKKKQVVKETKKPVIKVLPQLW
jgi:filamentous hemagglutinin family protein